MSPPTRRAQPSHFGFTRVQNIRETARTTPTAARLMHTPVWGGCTRTHCGPPLYLRGLSTTATYTRPHRPAYAYESACAWAELAEHYVPFRLHHVCTPANGRRKQNRLRGKPSPCPVSPSPATKTKRPLPSFPTIHARRCSRRYLLLVLFSRAAAPLATCSRRWLPTTKREPTNGSRAQRRKRESMKQSDHTDHVRAT